MSKTILITGGLGYLGSRIAESLITKNHYKIIIGSRDNRINLPKKLVGCELVFFDLLEKKSIQKCLKGVDIVLHLAAMNANECAANPEDALLVNGLGTLNLIQASQNSNVSKFIYFSTAHVYGSPLLGDITEETPTKPSNHYAISHRVAEDFIIEIGKKGKINTTILRLSNAVGYPIEKNINCWMLASNDMAKQIVEKNVIEINSSGRQWRDFISITNIINAVELFLENHSPFGEVYNLGSGSSLSILELANLISFRAKAVLNIDVTITTANDEALTDNYLNYKIEKIMSLGYSPKSNFEDEIDTLLLYVNKYY